MARHHLLQMLSTVLTRSPSQCLLCVLSSIEAMTVNQTNVTSDYETINGVASIGDGIVWLHSSGARVPDGRTVRGALKRGTDRRQRTDQEAQQANMASFIFRTRYAPMLQPSAHLQNVALAVDLVRCLHTCGWRALSSNQVGELTSKCVYGVTLSMIFRGASLVMAGQDTSRILEIMVRESGRRGGAAQANILEE